MNKVISVTAAAALGAGLMAFSPGAQAKPALPSADRLAAQVGQTADYAQYRGRRYGHRGYYRGRRNVAGAAGAAAAVGIAGALIGGAIAAQQQPRHYGYYDAPAYGYYAPQPAYRYHVAQPAYGYYRAPTTYYYYDDGF